MFPTTPDHGDGAGGLVLDAGAPVLQHTGSVSTTLENAQIARSG